MEKVDYDLILHPAVRECKASGREKSCCLLCKDGFKKGDEQIELFSSSYKGNTNYSNRFHYKCYLKVLAMKYPELLDDKFKESIVKEVCMNKLKK
jgi:hypothetical protein